MQAGLARLAHQLAARAQPDPMAVGVTHAESAIDGGRRRFGEFGREIVEMHIVRMGEGADVAERQQIVFGLQPQNFEHGLRPENAAARQVPIPQPAAAPVERGIDAAADRLVDQVRFPRPSCLPVEGETEDEHDEAGGGREGDGEGGERAPGCQRGLARLHHRHLAQRGRQHPHGRQCAAVVGQGDFHDPGAGAECGQRLRRTEQVDQAAADGGVGGWRGGRHHAVRIGEHKAPTDVRSPGRQRVGQHLLRSS